MAISDELRERYGENPDHVYHFEALSLSHDDLVDDVHYTNWSMEFTGWIEDDELSQPQSAAFVRMPFTISMPEKDTSGQQTMGINISNATRAFIKNIQTMTQAPERPMTVRYRVYLTTQTDADGIYIQQLDPPILMEVTRISVSGGDMTMEASKINTHNRQFPRFIYKPQHYPGLTR